MLKHPPISSKLPVMMHGADYNPDQWLHDPKVLEEDIRLMKLAGCNVMSVGIFAWAALEPEEGKFNFEWLDMYWIDCMRMESTSGLLLRLEQDRLGCRINTLKS